MPREAVNRKNNFYEVFESKSGVIGQFPGTVHGEKIAFSLTDCGCLPFTKRIRKFRLECKWKD